MHNHSGVCEVQRGQLTRVSAPSCGAEDSASEEEGKDLVCSGCLIKFRGCGSDPRSILSVPMRRKPRIAGLETIESRRNKGEPQTRNIWKRVPVHNAQMPFGFFMSSRLWTWYWEKTKENPKPGPQETSQTELCAPKEIRHSRSECRLGGSSKVSSRQRTLLGFLAP